MVESPLFDNDQPMTSLENTKDNPHDIFGTYLVENLLNFHRRYPPGFHSTRFLFTDVPLSFWGGVDPKSGTVIDIHHPWHGQNISGKIICLPSGRGSCTGSQVLLELIDRRKAPFAILLRDIDGLLAVGALVAQEVLDLQHQCPDIIWVGKDDFERLRQRIQATPANCELYATHFGNPLPKIQIGIDREPLTLDQQDLLEDWSEDDADWNPKKLIYRPEEENTLKGCQTKAENMAMRVIYRYARIMQLKQEKESDSSLSGDVYCMRPSFRSIESAHIDGCTYIGHAGYRFAESLVQAGGKVKVPTTLNSVSTDRRQWRELGVPEDYACSANQLGDLYLKLGCQSSFTCAPYLLQNPPKRGQHICWGESNAVVFANSVLGARTTKYADYLDICCAIAGFVPETCVHLDENRVPGIVLDARELVQQVTASSMTPRNGYTTSDASWDVLFPVLGHLCGSLSDGKVPLLLGLEPWAGDITHDHLKAFCAAFGTTGTSPLIHIAGVTPEASDPSTWNEEWRMNIGFNELLKQDSLVTVTLQQMAETFDLLDRDRESNQPVELIALGNPHLSVTECQELIGHLKRRKLLGTTNEQLPPLPPLFSPASHSKEWTTTNTRKHENVRIMACISRHVFNQAEKQGFIKPLQEFGVEFVQDTCWCMLLDPPVIPTTPQTATLTNSGKYAHYGPGLTNRPFRFASTADCIEAAITGTYPSRRPTWLPPTTPSPVSPTTVSSPLSSVRSLCTTSWSASRQLESDRTTSTLSSTLCLREPSFSPRGLAFCSPFRSQLYRQIANNVLPALRRRPWR